MSITNTGTSQNNAIHNIGYRRYDGIRLGRWHAISALYTYTLRGCFGLGRGVAAKLFNWFLIACMLLPTFVILAMQSQTKQTIVDLHAYTPIMYVIIVMFLAVVAPAATSRDLRYHSLPLYFARPMNHVDYCVAKLGAVFTAITLVATAPVFLLYAGQLLIEVPFWEATIDLLQAFVGIVLFAALVSAIGLLIASVTPRRGLGIAAIVSFLFGTYMVATVLQSITISYDEVNGLTVPALTGLTSPVTLYDGTQTFLFGLDPVVAYATPTTAEGFIFLAVLIGVTCLSAGLLVLRYRKAVKS